MDGTSKDKRNAGFLFRPATVDKALEQYPEIIVGISQARYKVKITYYANWNSTVCVYDESSTFSAMIPLSDYEKILTIVNKLGKLPLFKSDPSLSYSMARAEIRAIF